MLGFEGWLRVCQTEKVRAVFWPEETTMQRHRSVKEVLGNSIECTQEKEQKKRQKHRPEPNCKGVHPGQGNLRC